MTSGARAIGFVSPSKQTGSEYLRRLGRLRWRRRFPGRPAVLLERDHASVEAFGAARDWIVVRDDLALPLPGSEIDPASGMVQCFEGHSPAALPVVHTLAELERSGSSLQEQGVPDPTEAPALAFSVSDFPPAAREPVGAYVERLLSGATAKHTRPRLAAVVFGEDSGERPEVARHVPAGVRSLLDVGCGTGRVSAAIRRANPRLSVTGIERRPDAAARARERVDRVISRDADDALRELAQEGARFDAFLFADVLEHLEDPIGALRLARDLAAPGAALVASVPNVGHLSLVRDLVRGRFDPLPAGLADAGHLRWFTRSSLEEALQEAGWTAVGIEAHPGAPAPDAAGFLERARRFSEVDEASLTTYQWVAVAEAR